jgi:hypothetical protein
MRSSRTRPWALSSDDPGPQLGEAAKRRTVNISRDHNHATWGDRNRNAPERHWLPEGQRCEGRVDDGPGVEVVGAVELGD